MADHEDPRLATRALAAYYASDQPMPAGHVHAKAVDHAGKGYVLVRGDGNRLLAVYRIRTSGVLKRLKRWPTDLGQGHTP